MLNKRENWIDITKGIAIFLVVLGHMLRGFTSADMFSGYSNTLKYIDYTIYSFHMPLFFLLSGYLYSLTQNNLTFKSYKKLIFNKILALGIPYFVFTLLQGFINLILSSKTNGSLSLNDLLLTPFKPLFQFWFLYALFFIFIFIPLLDLIFKNKYVVFIILLLLKLSSFYVHTHIFFIDTILINGIYFYLGKVYKDYHKSIINNVYLITISSLLYILINLFYYKTGSFQNLFFDNCMLILLAILGIFLCLGLTKIILNSSEGIKKVFINLGKYSFQIYLLHIIFMSGARIILSKILKIDSFVVHAVFGLAFGILIPIIIAYISNKFRLLNFWFFPNKYINKK